MEPTETPSPATDRTTKVLRAVVGVVVAAVVLFGIWLAYVYAFSPAAIRHPTHTHSHLRLQIINEGTAVNFGDAKYQTVLGQDICTSALTAQPVHFHDGLDQFVHLHWAHLSGGIVLKDYGWNFIGGPDDTLGYRFDQLPRLPRVPIHGMALPKPARDAKYYVYTGNASGYKQRDWNDFLHQDLTDFLAGTPTAHGLIPAASAASDTDLARLNDVLGSVVIFAQKTPPTGAQVKARFDHLIPLPTSSCSG